jgi:hypothetical protein
MGHGVEEIEFVKGCGDGPFDILVAFMPIVRGWSNHAVPFQTDRVSQIYC